MPATTTRKTASSTTKAVAARKTTGLKAPVDRVATLAKALTPDTKWYDSYVSREIEGFDDLDLLAYANSNKTNTLIFGPTGPGKSHCVKAYAAREGRPVVTVDCNSGIDPATMFGQPVVGEDGVYRWQDSNLTIGIREGWIIHFSEIDRMSKGVQAVLHSLTDDNREISIAEHNGEVVKAGESMFVVGTYNHNYGHSPLDPATANRFQQKLKFDYETSLEAKVLAPFDDADLGALLDFADAVRAMAGEGVIDGSISTRDLNTFLWNSLELTYEMAVYNLLNNFDDQGGDQKAVKDALEMRGPAIRAMVETIYETLAASS